MFKFNRPMNEAILSPGSFLTLLFLVSLTFMSSTVYTSEIKDGDDIASTISAIPSLSSKESTPIDQSSHDAATAGATAQLESKSNTQDARQRSGRMFSQANHQSMPIESYASAYAATNSLSPSEQAVNHHHHLTQQQSATSDANTFTSFGETPPPLTQSSSSGGQSSTARQLSSAHDYASSPNYFASYMSPSSNEASYSGQSASGLGNYHALNNHHLQQQQQQPQHHHYYKTPSTLPLGYPTNAYDRYPLSGYYDRVAHHSSASAPFWASSHFNSGGLMSSATNAISHWTNGFSITEIICGLVAIAIGAVILGAPFFLIYLALMGNFSGSGTLSLTNPTQGATPTGGTSTTVNGRRKRLAVFEAMNVNEATGHPDLAMITDSVARHISPFVDLQRVSSTFKHLVKSFERYAPVANKEDKSANKKSS